MKRSRVFVERETWETAGDMEAKLPTAAPPDAIPGKPDFPYSNWGPGLAVLGVLIAIAIAIGLSVPIAIVDAVATAGDEAELSGTALSLAQMAQELSFFLVPFVLAVTKGATLAQAARRLGLVAFRKLKALGWAGAAVGIYLLFVIAYVALVGEPEQEDFADDLGPLWVQILLIAIAAPIGEEVCFRGMLFGGLRESMPMWAAGLISASLFGLLHVTTGISVVPPLIAFGFLLAMLYEKTGSIVPCVLLHMLNNSVALTAQ
jgi:membrane protease YdiL (CAAX protease family)